MKSRVCALRRANRRRDRREVLDYDYECIHQSLLSLSRLPRGGRYRREEGRKSRRGFKRFSRFQAVSLRISSSLARRKSDLVAANRNAWLTPTSGGTRASLPVAIVRWTCSSLIKTARASLLVERRLEAKWPFYFDLAKAPVPIASEAD